MNLIEVKIKVGDIANELMLNIKHCKNSKF